MWCGGAVGAADEDVADALGELANVGGPGVGGAELGGDPGLDLASEGRRLFVADQALGKEEDESGESLRASRRSAR